MALDQMRQIQWRVLNYNQLSAAGCGAEGLLSFSPDSGIPATADSRCINEQFWCSGVQT